MDQFFRDAGSVFPIQWLYVNEKSKLKQKSYLKNRKEISGVLKTHMRSTIIQQDKKGNAYSIRITGIPEEKANEVYDLLEMKISSHRIIKKSRDYRL